MCVSVCVWIALLRRLGVLVVLVCLVSDLGESDIFVSDIFLSDIVVNNIYIWCSASRLQKIRTTITIRKQFKNLISAIVN